MTANDASARAIRSMTGYGQGSAELGSLKIGVELRSVNNRFTDLRFRVPGDLLAWEADLRRRILGRVRRGRVEVSVGIEPLDAAVPVPTLNRPLLDGVLATARQLADDGRIEGSLDLAAVLSLPGILRADTPEIRWGEEEREALHDALDSALGALDAERRREGEALRTEMLQRIAEMERFTAEARKRAAQVPAAARDRLLQRLRSLGGEVELDPARIAQEAAFLADRGDVTEEIVRLEGHLSQARSLLERPDGEPVGKRLDFLLQEIHRETNTICSKSADLELTRSALALKMETEKIREQAQNLE